MSFRRPSPILGAKCCQTDGCGRIFQGQKQKKFCEDCRIKRTAQSNHDSQVKRRRGIGQPQERELLTEAEIEAVFQAALKEIRRERKHEADVSTSQAWKYQEPGR